MNTPVVKLPRSFGKGVEGGRRPQEDALQPHGERFDRLCGGTRLGINFDDVRGVPGTVVFSETGHRSLLQLFDPFDLPLKAVADIDGETRVLSIEDVPLGASLEGVGVGFDKVLKSVDPGVELTYFGCVNVLPLLDHFEQCFGDPLQGVRIEVSAAVEDVSGRSGRDGVVGDCMPRRDGNG